MELKLSKKRGFVETFWHTYQYLIISLGKIIVAASIGSYTLYILMCLWVYGCGYRDKFTLFGIYNLGFILGIAMIYLLVREVIKIKVLQKVPITKEELQDFGCNTQEDVMVCLMFYRYFYVWKHQTYFKYPDYMAESILKTTESFPSILSEEDIEILDQTYEGPFSFKYVLEQRKSGKGLGPYTDKYDYEFLRKYVTPELIPTYDILYSKIKE